MNGLKINRAFTLIELLVVIAIIGMLAAILFPVFTRARENARRSSCSSNLKQLGLGVMQYLQDFDERYPARLGTTSNTIMWTEQIYPYVNSIQLFKCPSNPIKGNMLQTSLPRSYAMSDPSTGGPYGAWSQGMLASRVVAPGNTAILGETRELYGELIPDSMFVGHLQTTNVGYADGHVKSMRLPATCIPPLTWNITNTACSTALIADLQTSQALYD